MTPIERIAAGERVQQPRRRLHPLPSPSTYQPPATPPPELKQDLAVAQHVIEELQSRQVDLHFEVDEAEGRVRVQVRNGAGEVIREIPTRSLLETLSGGGLLIDLKG